MNNVLLSGYAPSLFKQTFHPGVNSGPASKDITIHQNYANDDDDDNNYENGVVIEEGKTNVNYRTQPDDHTPVLKRTDLIYKTARWGNPIVIKEYKLLFFTIPKVACTEWKLLFRRMLGLPEWPDDVPLIELHDPTKNQLPYLSNFTLKEAQEMLTSDEWTRAVFVREPKERVLSAFLNKFVEEPIFFIGKCCRIRNNLDHERKICLQKPTEGDFIYFLNRTLDCRNPHWTPQVEAVDKKWWGQMTFVGYMNQVAEDAERLLKSIHSSDRGTSAWDDFGKTGWGIDGNTAFMVRDTAHHVTNAHDKLKKYYTPCTEQFVEKHWKIEWNHDIIHFDMFHLFDEDDYRNDKECAIV
jgi:hypothetical protein